MRKKVWENVRSERKSEKLSGEKERLRNYKERKEEWESIKRERSKKFWEESWSVGYFVYQPFWVI